MGHSELSAVAPGDLDGYYRSIEHPFWVAWRAISRRDDPTGIFLVGFLLCLVPVIPFLASALAGIVYGKPTVHVWRLRFEPSSFWLWWPALTFASFLLLLLIGRSQGRLTEHKIQQLSPQQLRFAYCYGALDEIRRYCSSGVPQHIETADAYLSRLVGAMMRASTLDLAVGGLSVSLLAVRCVGQAADERGTRLRRSPLKPAELVPPAARDRRDRKGFPRVRLLRERAADGKDLAAVESALTDLGTFLYTEIANVPGAAPRAALERVSTDSLLSFARK